MKRSLASNTILPLQKQPPQDKALWRLFYYVQHFYERVGAGIGKSVSGSTVAASITSDSMDLPNT